MRKRILLAFVLLAISQLCQANPVDLQTAREVGTKFLRTNTGVQLRGSTDLELVKTYSTESDAAAFYVFNAPNGYVIVAADDCAHPILGYSDESRFNEEDVPINMQEYLEGFVEQIAYGVENQLEDPVIARQWQLVQATGRVTENRSTTVVEPLLTDTWGQGGPYSFYCPYDEEAGYHAVVGCVATSMGEIMRYWGFPAYGTGSMTYGLANFPEQEQTANFGETLYDWDNMPDDLYDDADSTQIKAVATLLWHCGVSVQINYGLGATSGNSEEVANALINYFHYSTDLHGVYRGYYAADEWMNMVKSCLDLARPIHYSGGSHAFVCDGYDADDYFHFNWGWYGSLNGYFQLDALNPGGSGNYHEGAYAIFDIHPNCAAGSSYDITASTNVTEGGVVTGVGNYKCGDGCLLQAIPADGYRFCSWTENGNMVSTNPNYGFTVLENKNLVANFVEDDGDFCTIVFDLYDAYLDSQGNGWENNRLTVSYSDGCFSSEELTIKDGCAATITRVVPDGCHIVLGWMSGYNTPECYFTVSYENGPLIYEGYNIKSNFSFEFDVDCDGSTPRYHTINAVGNPTEGGMVSGGGSYMEGVECTVTATTNEGYTFVNWTCIGEVLSTETTYAFTVTKDMNLVANFVSSSANNNNGALCGAFSVSDSLQVHFSQGNLQYIGSTDNPYWKFAEHQWDYLGEKGNSNLGRNSYKSNRDLFCWGTSGYDHGAWGFEPWRTIQYYRWYYAYGGLTNDLSDFSGKADWGYNRIVNGGNAENSGWRTLSYEEWQYLLFNRVGADGKRGMATVNGIQGMVLLPDTWNLPNGCTFNPGNGYGDNVYNAIQWAVMEANGAVFLPAAGRRDGSAFSNVGSLGNYWSTSAVAEYEVYQMGFRNGSWLEYGYRYWGNSVRLIRPTENYSFNINPQSSPAEGGTVTGAGTYYKGQHCVLSATANEGYSFVCWMENGKVVSSTATYSFLVARERELFAVFIPDSNNAGALKGAFSVNDSVTVHFSQGNLQYQASNNLWRFAEYQWDFVGGTRYGVSYGTVFENGVKCDNAMVSPTYSGWIDLFGWGTSGYDHGAVCYQPWSTSNNNSDYYAYDYISYNLYDRSGQADWGYNPIINGGNTANTWRTLTKEELYYLFYTRTTTSGIRYAKAKVNEVNGLILLPDDWSGEYYNLVKPNVDYGNGSSFENNIISLDTWTNIFEAHGAVFLPTSSFRSNLQSGVYFGASDEGYYWSSSVNNDIAVKLYFDDTRLFPNHNNYESRSSGFAVRLVRLAGNYYGITASANRYDAGTVNGGGAFLSGTECVLTATANEGFAFVNWTKDGVVVSTNPTYSFTVTGNQHLVATFYGTSNIGINAIANPAEAGTITGAGNYLQYQTCNLTATANDGYVFVNWTENNEVVSNSSIYSFVVTESRNLLANFINADEMIHINACPNPVEGGSITGTGVFFPGEPCVVTALANKGYAFQNWTENGEVVSSDYTYCFTATEDRNLEAHFIQICFDGAFNSVFSVSSSRVVCFSQGNLQYQASTNTWRFAENQYDHVGSDNANISPTYDGWIDLFGWGTSGYDHGAVCYQPWSTSQNNSDYYAYGDISSSLYDQDGRADWGCNAISNGGNIPNYWRTLTQEEWNYLLLTRNTDSGIRFARAQVNGVYGVILLPDSWSVEYYHLVNPNTYGNESSYANNVIDLTTWRNVLEAHGAIFLPVVFSRVGTMYMGDHSIGTSSTYWTSTISNNKAYLFNFMDTQLTVYSTEYRSHGNAVRLVHDPILINVISAPENGGTVTGGGVYSENVECTLTATANEGYVFVNWTENGEVVSTDATYSFTVTESRDLAAHFISNQKGLLNGAFSVSNDKQVHFSQGNLQYHAPTGSWQFTANQYDFVGSGNANASSDYNGWIDLFGWGTSGYDHGAVCYQPWSTSKNDSDYYAYGDGSANLYDQTGQADWGYNAISNSGDGTNLWRTLSGDEWLYLLQTRNTSSGIRFAEAQVNGVNGLLILPDDWNSDYYTINNPNLLYSSASSYSDNPISLSTWTNNLEAHGAVFLPAAHVRNGSYCNANNSYGYYWSSTNYNYNDDVTRAYSLYFGDSYIARTTLYKYYGSSVRLVCSAHTISTSANPVEGGTINGGGLCIEGAECILSATANSGYIFANWTENGEVVSVSATYGFTVSGDRDLVANFIPANCRFINATANPEAGGMVNGGGVFEIGAECTLVATANEGCSFVNWTENGEIISASTTYSFTVTESRDLVADFFIPQYDINATADPEEGGSVVGAGSYQLGQVCTLSATANEGYYFIGWTKDGVEVSNEAIYSFTVTEDASFVAHFEQGIIIGSGTSTNVYLPSYSYYKYSLTQQIYTNEELGGGGSINSISFYNAGETKTRSYDFYLVPTEKTAFESATDWIVASESQLVFSGEVTMNANAWTCLQFETPFLYDGVSNIALIVDDNSGNWSNSPHMSCRVFNAQGTQSVRVYSDNTNYDPYDPSGYVGTLLSVKNQIRLGMDMEGYYDISATVTPYEGGTVSGFGKFQDGATCTLIATANEGYVFANWTENDEIVSNDTIYSFTVSEDRELIANFNVLYYTVTAMSCPAGGGSVTGTGSYPHGQLCTLSAVANEGFDFICWIENGEVVSNDLSYSIIVTGNRNLVASFASGNNNTGVLRGAFSVSANGQVHFSQGNLQYQASNNIWRFADHQWDYVGGSRYGVNYGTVFENDVQCDNTRISSTYSGWIDLFGWGTSGYDHGAVCYQPWSISTNYSDYYAYGGISNNLYDQDGRADWGYNVIANGGNTVNVWRTLTKEELNYLFNTRNTPSGIRYAKGRVNNINGLIVLPDNWNSDYYNLVNPNVSYGNGASFDNNVISLDIWNAVFETHGAVFLPTSSFRLYSQTTGQSGVYFGVSNEGYYWSSSTDNSIAVYLYFDDTRLFPNDNYSESRSTGFAVRLVCSAHTITTLADPIEGGMVSGGGLYIEGTECTITAEGDDDHLFINWTKDGEVVTTNPTYTFTVTESQNYVAHFAVDDRPKQTTSLGIGWNWYSTYLEIGNSGGLEMLENSLGEHCEMICSQTAFTTYYPTYGWYGSLTNMVNEKMYRLKMASPTTVTMRGALANPIDHPITMVEGWNHIGFLSQIPLSVVNAFSEFQPMDGDMVKTQATFARYYDGYGWYGSLNTVDPGDGLMYKSVNSESVTFTYPQSSRVSTMENLTAENDHWVPNMCHYKDNMTMIAVVELDGQEIVSEKYEVAAFANGECRGSVRLCYVEPLKRYVAFLTMGGEDGDEVVFRLYSREDSQALGMFAEERVRFTVDEAIGSGYEPKVLHFNREELGFELPECELFPNPTDGRVIVRSDNSITMITVTDALGQVVYRTAGNSNETIMNLGHCKAGIYLVYIETSKGVVVKKLSLK